ncbi:MAG: hypothetical protein Fur0037_20540 [Planctomycetota bacterium]
MNAPSPDHHLDLGQLAALLGLRPAVIRAWLDRGLLAPASTEGRISFFDFKGIAAARALKRFADAGWSASRIACAVESVRPLCGSAAQALAGLVPGIGKRRPVIRLPDGRLVEAGGQRLFDFARVDGGFGRAGPGALRREGAGIVPLRSGHDWFRLGVEAEAEGRLLEAIRAYEHVGPGDAAAQFNMGNCHYALGDRARARECFAEAVRLDPEHAEAWNNLGIAEGDLGRPARAREAFARALRLVPHYADAHFNLAEALAEAGDLAGARAHWRSFLIHAPNSRSAEDVRRRLRRAEKRAKTGSERLPPSRSP